MAAAAKVRNVVLVGQDGSGKTSLAESMLYITGRTARMGTTADGKSNLDYDPEEIKRRFSVSTSIAPVEYNGYKINVLDTSGHPDFVGETLAAMQAAEMAVFVVDAAAGPQVMTTKLWKAAGNMGLARAIFINHCEKENTDIDATMAALKNKFGNHLGYVSIPMGVGSDFKGVADIVALQARTHADAAGADTFAEIPADFQDAVDEAREGLVDCIAEADEEIMMMYLEGEEITQDQIEGLLGTAIEQELLIPVFAGSALMKTGVVGLLDAITTYFPAPEAVSMYKNTEGEDIAIDAAAKPTAFVFKTAADPFVGRLSFVKILGGTIEPGSELVNSRSGKKERLGRIYQMMGKETTEIKTASAGDIVVIPKLAETRTFDTLSADGVVAVPVEMPEPMYPVAIAAAEKKEEEKLGTFLARATENDPTIQLSRNEETHQLILKTMGDTATELIISRMKDQAGVTAALSPVRVPYRETIRKVAEAQGRHKKQTGGSGQFGDCWLRLEPNPGGEYEFLDEVVGGRIPRNYIPAVDKGVQDAMKEGFLAGYPMVEVKCAVFDGSYHPVDSNEMAFKTAARIGFRNCCEKANPVLLEPMANVAVTTPSEYSGAIMGDISTRRGRISGTDTSADGDSIIMFRAPYAEVIAYTKDLRSMTRGSASYTLEVEGYEEAPMDVRKKLVEEYQAAKNA